MLKNSQIVALFQTENKLICCNFCEINWINFFFVLLRIWLFISCIPIINFFRHFIFANKILPRCLCLNLPRIKNATWLAHSSLRNFIIPHLSTYIYTLQQIGGDLLKGKNKRKKQLWNGSELVQNTTVSQMSSIEQISSVRANCGCWRQWNYF